MTSLRNADLAFSFRAMKSGVVTIFRGGSAITVLRGVSAQRFLEKVGGRSLIAQQQLMARATGNYKRGNERGANAHSRNRSADNA
ncbi:MAG: hypothetical protein ABIR52_05925 [Casimicrobiaceae bacterium]